MLNNLTSVVFPWLILAFFMGNPETSLAYQLINNACGCYIIWIFQFSDIWFTDIFRLFHCAILSKPKMKQKCLFKHRS